MANSVLHWPYSFAHLPGPPSTPESWGFPDVGSELSPRRGITVLFKELKIQISQTPAKDCTSLRLQFLLYKMKILVTLKGGGANHWSWA